MNVFTTSRRRSLSAAKTRIIPALCVVACLAIATALARPELQTTAQQLFSSLSEEQKTQAILPFDSPERNARVYTGGKRAGIQIKDLTPDQQKLAEDLITQFTSA